ncbi:MAG: Asp-tRNA(Asn)/Glu-tRNA(Gln) amidotransferase subunit GatB [Candidatus Promineifilaceae bacterium]|nr:Asp-tRNA(Asn)/Glu-tRNA(Gln) amidotransferase subunit GatB [Candidatus Promineifilaceae bacterium]
MTRYEPVIGLEVHAELMTDSKMFCGCRVVDSVEAPPNTAVCPVCLGMPGMLPVINRRAVEFALRVALALNCEIQEHNIFARKNYFYPDLPKGYQISQYELPLARHGWLAIPLESGETKRVGIRRVHMEEDTGKLTHLEELGTLVDYNRSGVPLLEIVSEPDLHSADEVHAYATRLRQLLRYLEVNAGDLEKGVLRVEPNISLRPAGSTGLGTRTEVKNLNSFRALAAATAYEIERQAAVLDAGDAVVQETRGWHEERRETFAQRGKEEAEDYRYFAEPDLPPLKIEDAWVERVGAGLPELPAAKIARYVEDFALSPYDAAVLAEERPVAEWFEEAVAAGGEPKAVANWLINNLFALMNESGQSISEIRVTPAMLVELLDLVEEDVISHNTAKDVLVEMFEGGRSAPAIVEEKGLSQISDEAALAVIIDDVLAENPEQVETYLGGKEQIRGWFVGQVMRATRGKANPQLVNRLLSEKLDALAE